MYTTFGATQQLNILQCDPSTKAYGVVHQRRSATYKPNIWNYGYVQSLGSEFIDVVYRTWTETLKEEFIHSLSEVSEISRLLIVDSISKLGLSSVFTEHIKDALDSIASNVNNTAYFKEDILKTALSFRLLRQHGYNVSPDVLIDCIDAIVPLKKRVVRSDLRGVVELFEASHLAIEGEEILVKVKVFSSQNLMDSHQYVDDDNLAKQVAHALNGPCHLRVLWFDVRHQIHSYEQQNDGNKILLHLAKLNFNITQAMLMEDLKEMSRWWKNLGLIENINFSRDRLVESFLWSVGIAYEPQYTLLRKCLTKVVTFVLVIDDLYDIYGSLEELKIFTRTVERWDCQELHQLPECMKICFETLRATTDEIANEIRKEKGWDDTLFYLKKAWTDFCKALLSEAWWYNTNHIPSLEDYLRCAWITSSGPLLSLVTLLCGTDGRSGSLEHTLEESRDLVYYISLIIRLCNDLETSAAEVERGDSPSSILCYMVEAKVSEDMAREHVKKMISDTWYKINQELLSASPEQQTYVNLIINIARVCQFIYRQGDAFSVPDKDTRKLINALFIQPIKLSMDCIVESIFISKMKV